MKLFNQFLCAVCWAALPLVAAQAQEPPTAPILRINPGMHMGELRSSAFDQAGRSYITSSHDRTARIWSVDDKKLAAIIRPPTDGAGMGVMGPVSLSPDGKDAVVTFTSGSNNLFVFSATGVFRGAALVPGEIQSLAWSDDSKWLIVSSDQVLVRLDPRTMASTTLRKGRSGFAIAVHGETIAFNSYKADGNTSIVETCRLDASQPCKVIDELPAGYRVGKFHLTPDGRTVIYERDKYRDGATNYEHRDSATGVVKMQREGALPTLLWDDMGNAYSLSGASLRRYSVVDMASGALVATVPDYYFDAHLAGGSLRYIRRGSRTLELVKRDFASREAELIASIALPLPEERAVTAFNITALAERGIRFAAHARSSNCFSTVDLRAIPNLASRLAGYKPGACTDILVMPDGGAVQSIRFMLRRFAPDGSVMWSVRHAADHSLGMASSTDGRWIGVRAEDGTLRLMAAADGREALAAFEHEGRWVMSTPSGYYDTSPSGEDLVGWQINRGAGQPADFFPASRFRSQFYRPDVLTKVLETGDEAEALRRANQEAGRRTQLTTIAQVLPPVVEIVSPIGGTRVSQASLTLKYNTRTPADAPVTTLRVRINGQTVPEVSGLVRLDAGGGAGGTAGLREVSFPIPPQDSEIQLFAENKNGVSTPAVLRVTWAGAKPAAREEDRYKPKLYVLAVGVSKYANPDYNLGLAAKDATDLAAVFQNQKGKLFADVQVRLLTDSKASKDDVLDGLEWLKREVTARDVGVMFLAGHGMNDNTGKYFFMPHNADPAKLLRTGVPQTDIKDTLNSLAGKAVFFVDTCHSGNALGTAKTRAMGSVTDAFVNELAAAENGVVVFAASTGRQLSQEDPAWGNGAFTKAVVEGLNGKADFQKTGKITHKGLDFYVSERVKELTRGTQSPVSIAPQGVTDFPIAVLR